MQILQRAVVTAGCIGIFCLSITSAQTPSNVMQLRKYAGASMTLYYHLFKPTGYSSAKKYPIIFTFHGVGENGDSSNTAYINKNGLVSNYVSNAFQAKHACFVAAPHVREPNETWIDTPWTVNNAVAKYKQGPISKRLSTVMQILDSLEREFSIDTNRIYITGLSIGGWATWDLVTRFPNKFAAAFPQSGGVDTSKAKLVAQTPIWCYHGRNDNTVTPLSDNLMFENIDKQDDNKGVVYPWCHGTTCPAEMTAAKIDSLTNAGMIHFYTLDPNQGHDGWDKYYGDTLIQNWLMKQSRSSATAISLQSIQPRTASAGRRSAILRMVGLCKQPASLSGFEIYDLRGKLISGSAVGSAKLPSAVHGVVLLARKPLGG